MVYSQTLKSGPGMYSIETRLLLSPHAVHAHVSPHQPAHPHTEKLHIRDPQALGPSLEGNVPLVGILRCQTVSSIGEVLPLAQSARIRKPATARSRLHWCSLPFSCPILRDD